jgi:predicted ATPase
MLRRLFIDNYRCFVNFEFRPADVSLLFGSNGAGKSTMLRVLEVLREIVDRGAAVHELLGASLPRWSTRRVQSFALSIELDDGLYEYSLQLNHSPVNERVNVASETLTLDGRPLYTYEDGIGTLFNELGESQAKIPFSAERSFIADFEQAESKVSNFKRYLRAMWTFQLVPQIVRIFSNRDEPYLAKDGSNFVSWLRFLNEEIPSAKQQLDNRFKEIVPGFRYFAFNTVGDQKGLFAAFGTDNGKEYRLSFIELSDGIRALAMMYSVVFALADSKGPKLVCFDEPGNFLALEEIQPWLQQLRDSVDDAKAQVIVVSHNPEVIDYLAADSVFRFDRKNELSNATPIEFDRDAGRKASELILSD